MSPRLLLASVLALATPGAAGAQPLLPPAEPPGPHAQTLPTPDFVAALAQSDQFEREEGRLAAMRARDPRVRRTAGMMVEAHAQSTRALTAAAARSGLPPAPPPGLGIGQQQMVERLKTATGGAFDRLYVDQQVAAHRKALATLDAYLREGDPGPIRRAATDLRPAVARHLALFERLQAGGG